MTNAASTLLSRADATQTDDPGPIWMGRNPAENRKVGGSIPSLPTRSAQVSGLRAEEAYGRPKMSMTAKAKPGKAAKATKARTTRPAITARRSRQAAARPGS
jgi:hypothetical protein